MESVLHLGVEQLVPVEGVNAAHEALEHGRRKHNGDKLWLFSEQLDRIEGHIRALRAGSWITRSGKNTHVGAAIARLMMMARDYRQQPELNDLPRG